MKQASSLIFIRLYFCLKNFQYPYLLITVIIDFFTKVKPSFNLMCNDRSQCGKNERCSFDKCTCDINFEFDHSLNGCKECPGLGEPCSVCCAAGLTCINKYCACPPDNGYFNMCHPQGGVFITASQIALSAALVMGIAALIMVIYRLCTRPRYLNARHQSTSERLSEIPHNPNQRNNNFLRASLTSIQIRVLSRLRDRPPPYDSQTGTRTISQNVDRQSRMLSLPEAPPPYEGHRDTGSNLPPPYTEIIVNPTGFLNPSYADTESSVTISRFAENSAVKSKEETSKPH